MEEHARTAAAAALQPFVIIEPKKKPHVISEKLFILTLERLPVLWDKSHPNYTNKFKRNEALEKLLVVLKRINPLATVEHVKMKINSVRSNYRRELRKVIASRSAGEVYTPRAWSYELLGFLYNTEKPKHQSYSEDTDLENTEFEIKPEIYGYDTDMQTHEVCMPELRHSDEETPSCSKKVKMEHKFMENDAVDHEITCSSEPNTYENNIPNSHQYIAMGWAETLSRLDPVQRLYAKKAINDILFEAELGNLTRIQKESNDIAHPSSDIQLTDPIG